MASIPNPPQFDPNEGEEKRVYKLRQFVEEVIRTLGDLNAEVNGGGGSGSSSSGYPPQLGHARI